MKKMLKKEIWKIFWSQKILSKTNFDLNISVSKFCQNNFLDKEKIGPKNIWVKRRKSRSPKNRVQKVHMNKSCNDIGHKCWLDECQSDNLHLLTIVQGPYLWLVKIGSVTAEILPAQFQSSQVQSNLNWD